MPGPNTVSTYQWSRCEGDACVPIAGADGEAYTPVDEDVGRMLRVEVTAVSADGETETAVARS
jgi:hypothetical protein